jgi:hypothetical protein
MSAPRMKPHLSAQPEPSPVLRPLPQQTSPSWKQLSPTDQLQLTQCLADLLARLRARSDARRKEERDEAGSLL